MAKDKVRKFIVLLGTDYIEDGQYYAYSFETREQAEKFAKGEWRDEVQDAANVDEEEIYISEIQAKYVQNPSFVSV